MSTIEINSGGKNYFFRYRDDSEGDKGVIRQIFTNQDYDVNGWQQGQALINYHSQQSKIKPSLIVDAGANIGASVLYFSLVFPGSTIFSIEPDLENWKLTEENTKRLSNVHNFHGAISNKDGELKLIDPGRSDWGFMTVSEDSVVDNTRGVVKSISPLSIINHPMTRDTTPLIFKVDIEGGEDALFQGDVSWMNLFPLIIIELHDWMLPFSGSSRSFIKAVANFDFDLLHRGENIFLFNRRILGSV